MKEILEALAKTFRGDIDQSPETLKKYARDASLFEIIPTVVVYPKDTQDIQTLVLWATQHKKTVPDLSLTMRAAGTCMSGGAINDSVIVDVTRYMNRIIEITDEYAIVEPGCYFRDLEKELKKRNRFFPPYTASKDICALGGMYGNNCAGEKTLRYGKFENHILESEIVLSDGSVQTIRSVEKDTYEQMTKEKTFFGGLVKSIGDMVSKNRDALSVAKPKVSKNSAGYFLWNVIDDEGGFDLNQLLVGSQGTLGIVTRMKIALAPIESVSKMLVMFLPNIERLGQITEALVQHRPDSIESFDDYSLKLAFRFFFDFFKQIGFFKTLMLGIRFIPELVLMARFGIPKLILITEVCGINQDSVDASVQAIQRDVASFGYPTRIVSGFGAEKYWRVRRESFNLLRKHVRGLQTAPFIDDIIVPVSALTEFLPRLRFILDREQFVYTIAGHAGNGNFHVIPLVNLKDDQVRERIITVAGEIYDLVASLGGSFTAEHGDGIMRAPFLEKMYSPFIVGLFRQVKTLFDPLGILNPHKKIGVTRDYVVSHIKKS